MASSELHNIGLPNGGHGVPVFFSFSGYLPRASDEVMATANVLTIVTS